MYNTVTFTYIPNNKFKEKKSAGAYFHFKAFYPNESKTTDID